MPTGKKNRNKENREMGNVARDYLNSLFPKTAEDLKEEERQKRLSQRKNNF